MPPTVSDLLSKIANLFINPLIILGFVWATVYFFYAVAEMIWKADGSDLAKNKENVKYGIIGLFVMFSVYGILRLALSTFGIECTGVFFC